MKKQKEFVNWLEERFKEYERYHESAKAKKNWSELVEISAKMVELVIIQDRFERKFKD